MYSAEYYIPSHITGFFVPFFSDDFLKAGSTGAGVSLSLGTRTKIEVREGDDSVEVYVNGNKTIENTNSVSFNCINLIKERYPKYFVNKSILIEHYSDVPVESGFGASASAALGICFSIKDLINISTDQCVRFAHESEVKGLTGLGDVVSEIKGGVEIRKTPGIYGVVENIPASNLEILAVSLGIKKTESILKNPEKIKIIEKYGNKLLKKLIAEPSVEKMMECSKIFTYKTNIMSKNVLDLIELISENNSYEASGIMIGDGVFTFINQEDKNKVLDSLIDTKGELVISSIASGLL